MASASTAGSFEGSTGAEVTGCPSPSMVCCWSCRVPCGFPAELFGSCGTGLAMLRVEHEGNGSYTLDPHDDVGGDPAADRGHDSAGVNNSWRRGAPTSNSRSSKPCRGTHSLGRDAEA